MSEFPVSEKQGITDQSFAIIGFFGMGFSAAERDFERELRRPRPERVPDMTSVSDSSGRARMLLISDTCCRIVTENEHEKG